MQLVDLAPTPGGVDEQELLSRLVAPALLVPPLDRARGAQLAVTTLVDFDARIDDPRSIDLRRAEVLFLTKSKRNPFLTMITVGRAANNDIVLPAATVSKFHASFARESSPASGERWTLTDQRSANGTWVEAARLEPATAVPLPDEVWLRFGKDVRAKFVTPRALVALVARLR